MKKFLLLPLLLLSLAFALTPKAQAVSYPIAELGNCRDAQECRYYCEISENTPACWSYGKFVLQKNVLGESAEDVSLKHGISFPIAELGNCTTAQTCKAYCDQEQNRDACYRFAVKRGMVKQAQKQEQFADKEKMLTEAKHELGCSDFNSCRAFCENPDNRDKCMQFAKKKGMVREHREGQPDEKMNKQFMQTAKEKLGCDTRESCIEFCSKQENFQKCSEFANSQNKKHAEQRQEQRSGMDMKQLCDSPEACKKLCEEHPDKCRGYGGTQENMKQEKPCDGAESCEKWCKENPDKCKRYKNDPEKKMIQDVRMPCNNREECERLCKENPLRCKFARENEEGKHIREKLKERCATEKECYDICKANPDKCPGFPNRNKMNGFPDSNSQSNFAKPSYIPPSNTSPDVPVYYPPKTSEPYLESSPLDAPAN